MSVSGVSMRSDEGLARHTSLRVGGTCAKWAVVHEESALVPTLSGLRSEGLKITLIGQGTRFVPRDGGVSGAVVRLGTGYSNIHVQGNDIHVGAAVPVCLVALAAANAGLSGLEALANHGGSIGASLALDTGPEGGWDALVRQASWFARGGVRTGDIETARKLKTPLFLGVTLTLKHRDAAAIEKAMTTAWNKTPVGLWWKPLSRGSMRNAITRASLPGVRVRELLIPQDNPDMLVNLGGATAKELAFFERMVVDRVRRERGIDLVTRMVWAGSHGGDA
ncbi:MAG: UDP-N-acetylmuramate dehydrogenase [Myxococcota bacterium]|jgi:UDP-N-acetylmuramate dehydrogenase